MLLLKQEDVEYTKSRSSPLYIHLFVYRSLFFILSQSHTHITNPIKQGSESFIHHCESPQHKSPPQSNHAISTQPLRIPSLWPKVDRNTKLNGHGSTERHSTGGVLLVKYSSLQIWREVLRSTMDLSPPMTEKARSKLTAQSEGFITHSQPTFSMEQIISESLLKANHSLVYLPSISLAS